jgi:hypothetical protein
MYTQRRDEAGRTIPQNYSGNAFRYPPIGVYGEQAELQQTEKNKASPVSLPQEENDRVMPIYEVKEKEQTVNDLPRNAIGHGEGISEELLLLGLCLLLGGDGRPKFSRGEGFGDVFPYLLMLLFLG